LRGFPQYAFNTFRDNTIPSSFSEGYLERHQLGLEDKSSSSEKEKARKNDVFVLDLGNLVTIRMTLHF